MNDRVLKSIQALSLSSENPLPYNCYVSVGSRFVLYRRKGDILEQQTVDKFKKKSSQSLFVSIDDYDKYLSVLQNLFMPLWSDIHLTPQVVHDAFCTLCEQYLLSDNSNDLYLTVFKGSEELKTYFLRSNTNISEILQIHSSAWSKNIHSAAFALGIARGMKNSEALLSPSLMTGCLLKHHKIEPKPFFDDVVARILSVDTQSPQSIIAQVATRFETLTNSEKLSYKDALKQLLVGGIGDLGLQEMVALQNFLKELALI